MENTIRCIELADAKAVSDIYAPFVSDSATSFEAVPPDVPEIERRIRQITPRYPWLVFERSGAVLGFAYASAHHTRHAYQWSVDVSVYIDGSVRKRGIGRALYTALFTILRRQGYFNAYAGITLPNAGSVRLHESLGFTPVGIYSRTGFKFGGWHDVIWLQLRLSEEPVPRGDPQPAGEFFEDRQIRAFLHGCAQSVKLDPQSAAEAR